MAVLVIVVVRLVVARWEVEMFYSINDFTHKGSRIRRSTNAKPMGLDHCGVTSETKTLAEQRGKVFVLVEVRIFSP